MLMLLLLVLMFKLPAPATAPGVVSAEPAPRLMLVKLWSDTNDETIWRCSCGSLSWWWWLYVAELLLLIDLEVLAVELELLLLLLFIDVRTNGMSSIQKNNLISTNRRPAICMNNYLSTSSEHLEWSTNESGLVWLIISISQLYPSFLSFSYRPRRRLSEFLLSSSDFWLFFFFRLFQTFSSFLMFLMLRYKLDYLLI